MLIQYLGWNDGREFFVYRFKRRRRAFITVCQDTINALQVYEARGLKI